MENANRETDRRRARSSQLNIGRLEPPHYIELAATSPIGIAVVGASLVAAVVAGVLHPALRAFVVFVVAFPLLWIALATTLSCLSASALRLQAVEAPSRTHAMGSFPLTLTLANSGHVLPAIGVMTNAGFATADAAIGAGPWAEVPILEAGRAAASRWDVMAKQRGLLFVGPFRAAVELPGSAIRATAVFDATHAVTVLPAVYQLQPFVDALLAGRHVAVGRFRTLPTAAEEYVGAREYRPGDSPKLIHRVLSLRAHYPHQFYVREFQDPSRDDLSIVLDTAPPLEGDAALQRYRFEKAICFAAALCRTFAARRLTVRFVCQRGPRDVVTLRLRPRDADLDRLEMELTRVELAGDRTTVGHILHDEVRRQSTAVIFVSLRAREKVEQQRLPMITLTPDHVPVFTREVVAQ
jgi:uncharacterized protein (DUF58 family)